MASTLSKQQDLISSAFNTDIEEEVTSLIKSINDKMSELGEKASKYVDAYDNYVKNTVFDASLLKEEMKKKIVEVYNDDI